MPLRHGLPARRPLRQLQFLRRENLQLLWPQKTSDKSSLLWREHRVRNFLRKPWPRHGRSGDRRTRRDRNYSLRWRESRPAAIRLGIDLRNFWNRLGRERLGDFHLTLGFYHGVWGFSDQQFHTAELWLDRLEHGE